MAGLKLVPVDEGAPAIEIQGDRATVGRTDGVDHAVNDPSVSRQHALFERQAGGWTVTDQGSANGTFLDGQRITTAEVREGQEVRFGAKAFRVHIDWAEMPTAFMPAIAPAPPAPIPPRPIPPRPVASVPPLPPGPSPLAAAPPPVARPPIPPRPIPPRPVAPPAPLSPPAEELGLPPTIPPQRGPLVTPPRPPMPPSRSMASRRAPLAELVGFWREGKLLVFAKAARLPDRCVKCGEPAAVRLKRKLSWHNPLLALLIPLGVLIYAIVAAIVSKRATVEIPLCEAHRKRRTLLTGIGVALLFLGLFALVAALLANSGAALAWLAFAVSFTGMVLAIVGQILVSPRRIDDHFVWLRGVHESLLAGLPGWPGPTAALMGLANSGGLPGGGTAADPNQPTGMAQAAFVSGWLSIFLCPAPVAVVLGILGILDVRRGPGRVGMGRSVFGLVTGLVGSLALGAALVSGFLTETRRAASYTPAPHFSPPVLPGPTPPPAAAVVILSKDGALRIAAPAGWRSESTLNKNAELQACDAPQQVCVAVSEDDKKTTGDVGLARFSRFVRGQMLKKLANSSENTGISLQIGGHSALQFEIRGQADRLDFVYLHTSVETPGHFYQVLGWTSSDLFPREKAVLSAIAASFQPAAGR